MFLIRIITCLPYGTDHLTFRGLCFSPEPDTFFYFFTHKAVLTFIWTWNYNIYKKCSNWRVKGCKVWQKHILSIFVIQYMDNCAIFRELPLNHSPKVDVSLQSDILSWFRSNQSLFSPIINDACFEEEQHGTDCAVSCRFSYHTITATAVPQLICIFHLSNAYHIRGSASVM
jgi:hypothetical protein